MLSFLQGGADAPALRRDCLMVTVQGVTLVICHFKAPWPDADIDALLSLLLMLMPHLALAPYVRGMDPVLGLDELSSEQPILVVRRYVAVLAAAFGSTNPSSPTTAIAQGEAHG